MARPGSTDQPASKKARMSPPEPNTRSKQETIVLEDEDESFDEDEPFEYESDIGSAEMNQEDGQDEEDQLESDQDEDMASGQRAKEPTDVLVLSSDSEQEGTPVAPPEQPKAPSKGKMTARKQFAADVASLSERFGATQDLTVQNFKRDAGEDTVRFSIKLPTYTLVLSLMFPELSGYPSSHAVMCFSENASLSPQVEAAMEEVAQLPTTSDRSLNGIIEYLLLRIVRGEPSPFAADTTKQSQGNDTDEEFEYDDELIGLGPEMHKNSELVKALRRDFKELVKEGYRPGFTRVSELDLVVSVSKKVSAVGTPVRALQAWDSQLITGEVVYLTLLMNFGGYPVNLDNLNRDEVKFRVGISPKYKPSKAAIAAAFRSHSTNTYTKDEFQAISLSAPLDSLFHDKFQEVLVTRRRNDKVGWAGAESHCLVPGKSAVFLDQKESTAADLEEKQIAKSTKLPKDPMRSSKACNNYPLLAMSYLVRRFVLCPRFCLICYKRCDHQVSGALKPFVCESSLCLYQYLNLGLGLSIEREIITNTSAVDLLVQLAYVSAKEGRMKAEAFPSGLGLEVPETKYDGTWTKEDPVVDFDTLKTDLDRQTGVCSLILELPPISEMKAWLVAENLPNDDKLMGRRKLSDMRDGVVSNSAWKLLRWIVASNTSYLKQIEDEDELIEGIPKEYRQFRFIVGSPSKEHLLAENVKAAQLRNANAVSYPTLFAWHGSSVKNFHTILREGLHFKETINGRAYGNGCYFALQGEISMGTYAQNAATTWKNADFPIGKLAALAEIVNLPTEFVSRNPYLVVNKVDWIQCRYLIVARATSYTSADTSSTNAGSANAPASSLRTIRLDPAFRLTLNHKPLQIPDVLHKLEQLEEKLEDTEEAFNDSDVEIMREPTIVLEGDATAAGSGTRGSRLKRGTSNSLLLSPSKSKQKKIETFIPCDDARLSLVRLLPPPKTPHPRVALAISREMKDMIALQEKEGPIEAGCYFDPERSHDNLFTWIIELPMESFDQDLPLVKDMKAKQVRSLLMEIRFGDQYPFSPPFFRVVHPRFLPFIQGGGGHVTGGGSICMDLLTANGWSSVYSIPAVLLQIRMAMSNLEPRPARLDPSNWNTPYSMDEAVVGFKRAAQTHGWTVPSELEAIARGF
ncbi:uncharacterized protein JCM6883_003563 [Sporobolomyces salmoneus]|uniref:uncharacterized protein n=1 Tax=Sporobolomyces salmoneus TaxID=183962 RepID=UPI003176CB77